MGCFNVEQKQNGGCFELVSSRDFGVN